MGMKISSSERERVELAGLCFEVLHRDIESDEGADGGVSIEVHGDVEGKSTQVVRFDCFRVDPHYHQPPSAEGQLPIDPAEVGDPLEWALGRIREDLPDMIHKAGFPELAGSVDAGALRAGWHRVRDAVERTARSPRTVHTY